jgi:nicotinate phosphoribosyltransferase
MPSSALMTDLYELTMLAGYYEHGMCEHPASFDLFFRKNPFHGGYAVFAGLEPVLRYLEELHFTETDLAYLESLNLFKTGFLDYLKKFHFRCTVTAPPEGTVVFANEPLVTVEGSLAEAQLVETAMLNILNFQTLIATKAARIQQAAGEGVVVEFGLRRAHGPNGGLSVSRAAYIGGVRSTSNTWAGQVFGIPVKGTHAHSWVMAFSTELDAFRAYAEVFPDSAILLVDTYDTLLSGIPNAIRVAKELRAKGHELRGIRLDSGDLAYLSRQARNIFDNEGFPAVRIVASNELDEHVISSIRDDGGKVDIYGVGTELATAGGPGGGALGGVYKLVSFDGQPRMKTTSDITKATLPGIKSLFRLLDSDGRFLQDVICCKGEQVEAGVTVFDPVNPSRHITVPECQVTDLRSKVMEQGRVIADLPGLDDSADRCAHQLKCLPEGTLRLKNPHLYKVSISPGLHHLRRQLMDRYSR